MRLLALILIYLLGLTQTTHYSTAQSADSTQWHTYRNTEAGIEFRYPARFAIKQVSVDTSDCSCSIEFGHTYTRPLDPEADSLMESARQIEYATYYKVLLSQNSLADVAREEGFEQRDGTWYSGSLTLSDRLEDQAEVMDASDWFGLRANVFARYYYAGGGVATAAGDGVRFFAMKRRDGACGAFVRVNQFDAADEATFKRVVSSIRFLE